MNNVRLQNFIKATRQKQGLTLRAVADRAMGKISNAHVSQLETGRCRNPSPHILWHLSKGLRCDYYKLMSLAGYMVSEKKGARK